MSKHEEHRCGGCFNQPICKVHDKLSVALKELREEFTFKNIPIEGMSGTFLHRQISFKDTVLHLCSWFVSIEERKETVREQGPL